jgi:hypothetical protein
MGEIPGDGERAPGIVRAQERVGQRAQHGDVLPFADVRLRSRLEEGAYGAVGVVPGEGLFRLLTQLVNVVEHDSLRSAKRASAREARLREGA